MSTIKIFCIEKKQKKVCFSPLMCGSWQVHGDKLKNITRIMILSLCGQVTVCHQCCIGQGSMPRWSSVGCWLVSTVTARLVVDQHFLDNFDGEIVKTQGELVKTDYRVHTTCQWVEEKVETFRFYTNTEDGTEDEHQFELATVIDVNYNTDKIHNFHERWIWAFIYIRSFNRVTM